jgi:hypothetical protein
MKVTPITGRVARNRKIMNDSDAASFPTTIRSGLSSVSWSGTSVCRSRSPAIVPAVRAGTMKQASRTMKKSRLWKSWRPVPANPRTLNSVKHSSLTHLTAWVLLANARNSDAKMPIIASRKTVTITGVLRRRMRSVSSRARTGLTLSGTIGLVLI